MHRIAISIILLFLYFSCVSLAEEKSPYIVYSASQGVILQSEKYGTIKNPIRGTEVYECDYFCLQDERLSLMIKDRGNGEIFRFSGKIEKIYPRQIVNAQRYSFFDRFKSFLAFLAGESGFNTDPVTLSQCVLHKGDGNIEEISNITASISSQIRSSISDSIYMKGIVISKEDCEDECFQYVIHNNDSIGYRFTIFTVNNNGEVYHHCKIIQSRKDNQFYNDVIEYIPINKFQSINLSYFTMAKDDNGQNRTCYVLFFNEDGLYTEIGPNKYEYKHNWNIISRELKYQGDKCLPIFVTSEK